MDLVHKLFNLNTVGLPHGFIATIQCARAMSTRVLYKHKWRVLENYCSESQAVPFLCSVAVILSFLQDFMEKGKALSTIKVYLVAIAACHVGFDSKMVGQHSLVFCFMKGVRCKLPTPSPLAPSLDHPSVLNALCCLPLNPWNNWN